MEEGRSKNKIKCVPLRPFMRHNSILIGLLALLFSLLPIQAQEQKGEIPADSTTIEEAIDSTITISLLTCSPGQETYELYGHTAIRVSNQQDSLGVVYNYGTFDFTAPHFTWRFTLGECDYILAREPLYYFLNFYYNRGSSVTEQVLDLTPYEAARLSAELELESKPENRVYRYNIFRNNCTTRARDKIESCIRGQVLYPVRAPRNTFRTILHQFTAKHLWAQEGNDLLLGSEVDTLISERDEMFAPTYLMWYMDSAVIDAGHNRYRNLVLTRRILLPEDEQRQLRAAEKIPSLPLSPRALGWGMLVLGLCIMAFELKQKRIIWSVDVFLMFLQGLAGLLLCFMALFSTHPGVATNWQVWVLNPIPLLFIYSVVQSDRHHKRCIYHALAAPFLLAFIAFYFIIPQDFSELILPVAFLLLSRAVVHLLVYRTT